MGSGKTELDGGLDPRHLEHENEKKKGLEKGGRNGIMIVVCVAIIEGRECNPWNPFLDPFIGFPLRF